MAETEKSTTSPALIALAWLLVGLPLSWGVYKSALNAAKLFQPAAASSAAAPAASAAK